MRKSSSAKKILQSREYEVFYLLVTKLLHSRNLLDFKSTVKFNCTELPLYGFTLLHPRRLSFTSIVAILILSNIQWILHLSCITFQNWKIGVVIKKTSKLVEWFKNHHGALQFGEHIPCCKCCLITLLFFLSLSEHLLSVIIQTFSTRVVNNLHVTDGSKRSKNVSNLTL